MLNSRILLVSALIVASWPVNAQAQSPEVQSLRLSNLAVEEMAQKNYAAACPRLEEAVRLAPEDLGRMTMLAECYDKWARPMMAHATYARVEQAAAAKGNTTGAQQARSKMAELEPRLARMSLVVPSDVAATPGFVLTVNGAPIDSRIWGTPLWMEAAEHDVVAMVPGRQPWQRRIKVVGGESYNININVKLSGPPVANQPYPPYSPYYPYPPYPPYNRPGQPSLQELPPPMDETAQRAQYNKKYSIRLAGGPSLVVGSPSLVANGGFFEIDGFRRFRAGRSIRFDVGAEIRYLGNNDAAHWKLGVPIEAVFELGKFVELPLALVPGIAWIHFDEAQFGDFAAFDMRMQFGIQFAIGSMFSLGVTPLSFDLVNAPGLGGAFVTYEPRIWTGFAF